MRSIKDVKKVGLLKLDGYYKLKLCYGNTWLFQFKGYADRYGELEIISGESYCVESNYYTSEISGLCYVKIIDGNDMNIVKISLSEFNSISGREV